VENQSRSRQESFSEILRSIMETEVPPESAPSEDVDYLVREGFVDEHGNRKFHATVSGALYYTELFLRLHRRST
jgi:hypothetical protein